MKHEHKFERYELKHGDGLGLNQSGWGDIWYVGYRCECGEPGFELR